MPATAPREADDQPDPEGHHRGATNQEVAGEGRRNR
jgi:hypothetical protein